MSKPLSKILPAVLLAAVMLLLAFRLTASETLRETLSTKMADIAAQHAPPGTDVPDKIPLVGPPFIIAYACLTSLLAAAAAFLAGRAKTPGTFPPRRIAQFLLIALITILFILSTLHAANKFTALIGTLDVFASLSAAWTVALLCHDSLLGARGRTALLAGVIALVTMGAGKALLQYFVDYPDLMEYMKQHKDEALRSQGISDDPVQEKLFLARVASNEVTGFGAMSNVFATELIPGISLLAALLIVKLQQLRAAALLEPQPAKPSGPKAALTAHSAPLSVSKREIPVHFVALLGCFGALFAILAVLPLTGSKGGIAAALLTLALVIIGGLGRKKIPAWRRPLLATSLITALLATAAVLAYGLKHHGLPTLSLLYRWQYWTATLPIIHKFPTFGVGFNNFGDYYLQYKLPQSPEDVKDPHSFFVRFAAEAGIPVTLLVGGLIVWFLQGAFRKTSASSQNDASKNADLHMRDGGEDLVPGFGRFLVDGGVIMTLWVLLHFLTETPNTYSIILTLLFAVLGWSIYAAAAYLMDALKPPAMRFLVIVAVIGALGMLLYDQVNMALVTGPAAMLFWVLLGVGDSYLPARGVGRTSIIAYVIGAIFVAAAGLAFFAGTQTSWDPEPFEYSYIHDFYAGHPDQALQDINAAIERNPNSIELLMQRIGIKREILKQPVMEDVRRVLQLDRSNANIRVQLAEKNADLPPAERIAVLKEAMELDQKLPAREFKRLTPEQIFEIQGKIKELESLTN